MKPEIKLFFDFEFTSLSPDAQPISLGIISQETKPCDFPEVYKGRDLVSWNEYQPKSFYAEFSDFDLNHCDDWVKENVVKKLTMLEFSQELGLKNENTLKMLNSGIGCVSVSISGNETKCTGVTSLIKKELLKWLSQFSEYNIQFVCDCGCFDWYWMLQLLDERHPIASLLLIPEDLVPDGMTVTQFAEEFKKCGNIVLCKKSDLEPKIISSHMIGLPKFPDNISPVPEDLNDLIARKKGISIREAFDLNREDEVTVDLKYADMLIGTCAKLNTTSPKHNALWDAKIIKAIYEKLKP